MDFSNRIYNFVLYNYRIKKLATVVLKNPFFVDNYFYKQIYRRVLEKKVERFSEVPFRVMIENTNSCNADCVFCPHKSMKRSVGVMDLSLTERIVNDCKEFGISYVTIYGFGEPLLDKHFFERVEYAKSLGIPRVTTNTNAAFLTEKKARQLLESGIDEVYISFDAATAGTYNKIRPNLDFDKVESNLEGLINLRKNFQNKAINSGFQRPEITLSFVESENNRHEVQLYINKWKGKVDNISISIVHNWTGDISSQRADSKVLKRDPCRLLWTDMVVSWNGDVPLCCNDYENRVILGNVNESSIKEIWGGEKLKEIRAFHLKGEFDKISICADCEYNYHYKSNWWISK